MRCWAIASRVRNLGVARAWSSQAPPRPAPGVPAPAGRILGRRRYHIPVLDRRRRTHAPRELRTHHLDVGALRIVVAVLGAERLSRLPPGESAGGHVAVRRRSAFMTR